MTGVRYFRVTLPRAGKADIGAQALEEAVVPSYEHRARPAEILRSVKASLQSLAKRAKAAGVSALLEIHWGTVMSSFTSAHYLVGDLDPDAVAVTFDPANMVIEGKEDWGYGVQLLREHVANVHIKNVSWLRQGAPGSGTGMGCGGAWWTGHNCSACWPTPATAGCSPWKISASRRISTRRWFTCENCEETRPLLRQGESRQAA